MFCFYLTHLDNNTGSYSNKRVRLSSNCVRFEMRDVDSKLSDSFVFSSCFVMSTFAGSRSILMQSLYESIIVLPGIQFFLSSTDSHSPHKREINNPFCQFLYEVIPIIQLFNHVRKIFLVSPIVGGIIFFKVFSP